MIRLRAVIDLLARPSLTCPAIISILLWSLLYYKNEKKWAAVLLRLPQPTICQILIPSAYAISFPRPLLARSHYFRDHLQAPSPVTLSSFDLFIQLSGRFASNALASSSQLLVPALPHRPAFAVLIRTRFALRFSGSSEATPPCISGIYVI